jgi:tetratricopeptide (TPR) repeat protein
MWYLLAALAILSIFMAPARAVPQDPDDMCFGNAGMSLPARVNACTAILQRPLLVPEQKFSAHINRGRAFYLQRQFAQAIADYSAAIQLNPERKEGWASRAGVYLALGDLTRAQKDAAAVLGIVPQDPLFLNNSCWLHAAKREFQAALADCNRSLAITPHRVETLDSRGFAFFQQGQYRQALSDYNAVLAMDPRHASALYMRGVIKRKSGDLAGGTSDMRQAGKINPEIAESFSPYGLSQAN